MPHSQSYQQETNTANTPPWGKETPSSCQGSGEDILPVTVGPAEMQIPLGQENYCMKVTSVFSSLAIQVVGYHIWFSKSLSVMPPCEKAFPGTTGTLYQLCYRPINSYTTDEYLYGTLFFRSSYLLWRLWAVVIEVWSSSSWKSRFNLWLFPFSLEHKYRILSTAGKKYFKI